MNEREWRSALRGVRALLKCHPPRKRRGDLSVGRVRFYCHRGLKLINPGFDFERGRSIATTLIRSSPAAALILKGTCWTPTTSTPGKFGGDRVTVSDVLHSKESNPITIWLSYTIHAAR